jgi:hypothetical protein
MVTVLSHECPRFLQNVPDRFTIYVVQQLTLVRIRDEVFFLIGG